MEDAVIVGLDPLTLESADIAALATLAESLRLEAGVDDTPITFESEEQAWRSPLPSGARRVLAVARTDAGAVGRGDAIFMKRNGEHLAEIGILYVVPEFRRSGIGSRLLAEVLRGCHPDTLLVGTTTDRVPGGAFAASVGATVGLRHDRYKLEVAQIDWDATGGGQTRAAVLTTSCCDGTAPARRGSWRATSASPTSWIPLRRATWSSHRCLR